MKEELQKISGFGSSVKNKLIVHQLNYALFNLASK